MPNQYKATNTNENYNTTLYPEPLLDVAKKYTKNTKSDSKKDCSPIEMKSYTIYGEEVIKKATYSVIGYFTNYTNITTSIELKRFKSMSDAINFSYQLTQEKNAPLFNLSAYFKVITSWVTPEEYESLEE